MKKILLFSLLLAMTFVTTSLKAADGDVFTAPVTVIYAGETQQVTMRFKVTNESNKSCLVYGVYDEVSHTSNPAINYTQRGEVIIPEKVNGYTVIAIGSDAFHGCYLEGIQLPETIKAIYAEAFEESDLLEIDLPSSVAYVGGFCFAYCSRLISAKISGIIENGCFYNCPRLEQIEFKSPVTSVGAVAFTSCTSLRSITFPSGLKTIDMGAFGDCKTLAEVSLPSSTESINASAFWGCTNLRNVVIAREIPPTIDPNENSVLFADVFSSAVLHVPDRTKYTSESWASNFSEIKSFLPTVEQTVNTWSYYSVGLTWDLFDYNHGYTESVTASDILDLMIDGVPTVPEVWEGYNELIVSKDPKHVPQEVSFLRKTSKGLVPYKLHYNVHNFGFSINGKEMTSLDMYNIPGLVSGDAYIAVPINDPDKPTLVLDNATLEWDGNNYGIYNNNNYYFTIKVIGDCSITNKELAALELDAVTSTTIEGGGTLNITSEEYCAIRTWAVTKLNIQDNTKVIARSLNYNYGYYDEDGANLEIKDGAMFAVKSKYAPLSLDRNLPVFGEGIDIRYPEGAYFGDYNNLYYADGTKVENDWVVIGPDNQATRDLIAEINNAKRELGFSINGKEMTGADVNDVPGVTSGSAHIEVNEDGAPTLVLDNATLEWNDASDALYLKSGAELTIRVLGDCVINAPDQAGLNLSGNTTIEGGGTLRINSKWAAISNWEDTRFTLQNNTTLIAHSSDGYGYCDEGYDYDQQKSWFIIQDGGLFAAFGKYGPISFSSDRAINFDSYTELRYPVGGQLGNNYVYDVDGNEVTNDWVVIGPDDQKTQDLIEELLNDGIRLLGFSINGEEMTTANMDNVPGVTSGSAHIEVNEAGLVTLVLDNATLELNDATYGLHYYGTESLHIKVLGDCTIKAPNGVAIELELSKWMASQIYGGGTLHIISGSYPIEMKSPAHLAFSGVTVIAKGNTMGSAIWAPGTSVSVWGGAVLAAYGTFEPIHIEASGEFNLPDGIAVRYPADAYIGSDNVIYNADGTEVKGDWVVIGPDYQTTKDLIDELINGRKLGFSINGQQMTEANMDDVPGLVSGSAHIEVSESGASTLVLDNATLEWNLTTCNLWRYDGSTLFTIRVLGDCTINTPNGIAIGLDGPTSIEGGGTLHINSQSVAIGGCQSNLGSNNSEYIIQNNTTVIAQSEMLIPIWNMQGGLVIRVREGSVLAAYSIFDPIRMSADDYYDLGEGIALRYPAGAYIGSDNVIYNANDKKLMNDWVVFGPDDATTWELIDGVDEIVNSRQPADDGFIYNLAGQKISNSQFIIHNSKLPRGIYIQNGKKVIRK